MKTYGKNKKGNCDLLSHNSFFFFSGNYEFISRNYDFITRSFEFISHNSEKKVKIVRYKVAVTFLFLYSVAETGVHRNMSNVMKQII